MTGLQVQPTKIAAKSADTDGRLVFNQHGLIAVLVCLSEMHGEAAGRWFLEAGFGELEDGTHSSFRDWAAAEAWMCSRMGPAGPIRT